MAFHALQLAIPSHILLTYAPLLQMASLAMLEVSSSLNAFCILLFKLVENDAVLIDEALRAADVCADTPELQLCNAVGTTVGMCVPVKNAGDTCSNTATPANGPAAATVVGTRETVLTRCF